MKKGDIQMFDGMPGIYMEAVGAYFDWPWWKRRLSDLADNPYQWWTTLRGLWYWTFHEAPPEDISVRTMLCVGRSIASSRVKPVYWAYRHGYTSGSSQVKP